MKILYRQGEKKDSLRLAELDNIASGGAIDFLFHDLIPNMTPVQIVASNLKKDSYPHSYRSVIVAEHNEIVVGMALSFPGKYHKITDEMEAFFPQERIRHFRHFFSAPVKDSYFLDALCVDENFRHKGIGSKLIELTKNKARKEGYHSLSLIVFKDNLAARKLYRKTGFTETDWIDLAPHRRMPHEGGCVLMRAKI